MRKFKVISSVILVFVLVCVSAISVYALLNVRFNVGGRVKLVPHYVDAWVEGTIEYAYAEDGATPIADIHGPTRLYSDEDNTYVEDEWEINNFEAMYFGDYYATTLAELEPIIVRIRVYNNSNFNVKANYNLEFDNDDYDENVDVNVEVFEPLAAYAGEKITRQQDVKTSEMPYGDIVLTFIPTDWDVVDFIEAFTLSIDLIKINQLPTPTTSLSGTGLNITPVEHAIGYDVNVTSGGVTTTMHLGVDDISNPIDLSAYISDVTKIEVVAKGNDTTYITSAPLVYEHETVHKGDLVEIDMDGDGEAEKYKLLKKVSGESTTWEVMGMYNLSNGSFGENNTYNGSDIDTFLNTTVYNSLPDNIKSAIVPKTIEQDRWFVPTYSNSGVLYDENTDKDMDYVLSSAPSFYEPVDRYARSLSIQDLADADRLNDPKWILYNNNDDTHLDSAWLSSSDAGSDGGYVLDYDENRIVKATTDQYHSAVPVFRINITAMGVTSNIWQNKIVQMDLDGDGYTEDYRLLKQIDLTNDGELEDPGYQVWEVMAMYSIDTTQFTTYVYQPGSFNGGSSAKVYLNSHAATPLSNTQNASNVYAGSTLDEYINDWYTSLSQTAKSNIYQQTFKQDSWYLDVIGVHVNQGGEMLSASTKAGNSVVYLANSQSTPSASAEYVYANGHLMRFGSVGQAMTRNVYLPSLQDIIDYLGVTESMTIKNTTLTSDNLYPLFWGASNDNPLWLRSAFYDGSDDNTGVLTYFDGQFGPVQIYEDYLTILPVFQMDLSGVRLCPPQKSDIITMDLDGDGEGEQYRILKNVDGTTYEVVAMEKTGTVSYNTDGYNSKYEDSKVDTYLNETWFNTLTQTAQNAIVPKEISQDSWGSGTYVYGNRVATYTMRQTNSGSGNVYLSNYNLSKYSQHYPNTFTRNVYLLSVQEMVDYLGAQQSQGDDSPITSWNLWDMFYNTGTTSRPGTSHPDITFRSEYVDSSNNTQLNLCKMTRYFGNIAGCSIGSTGAIRPVFQIDLVAVGAYTSSIAKGDIVTMNLNGTNRQYRLLREVSKQVSDEISEDEIVLSNVWEVMAMFNATTSMKVYNSDNTYEDSDLDNALTDWYEGLSRQAKNAIVEKTFTQDSWHYSESQPQEGIYYVGRSHRYNYGWSTRTIYLWLDDASYGNEITRKAYVLSIQDILDYLGVTTGMTSSDTTLTYENVLRIFKDEKWANGSLYQYSWLLSVDADNIDKAFAVREECGIDYCEVISGEYFNPVFQIDLSMIDYTLENGLPYTPPTYGPNE